MANTYQVKVVTPKEFSRLAQSDRRYEFVDEENLGFADPEKNVAYVRNTAWPELNKFLIEHEFDHLLNPENGADKDANGIYHKKVFKDLIAPIGLPILGGLIGGPLLGGGLASLGLGSTMSGILGAGLGSAAGGAAGRGIQGGKGVGRSALTAGLTGAAVKSIPAVFNAFKGAPVSPGVAGASTSGSTAPGLPRANLFNNIGQEGSTLGSSLSSPVSKSSQAVMSQFTGGVSPVKVPTTPPFVPPQQPAPASGGGFGPFNKKELGGLALGAGISTIPSLLMGTPKAPDFNSLESIQALRNNAGKPISDTAKLATQRLTERLGQTSPELDTNVESAIRRQYQQARAQQTAAFKAFRPGADLATDSEFAQQMGNLDQREAEAVAGAYQNEKERFAGQQSQDIATALGIDQQTLNTFTELAKLDIAQIMTQLGIDSQSASDFKKIFGQLGSITASKALGVPNISLGGMFS